MILNAALTLIPPPGLQSGLDYEGHLQPIIQCISLDICCCHSSCSCVERGFSAFILTVRAHLMTVFLLQSDPDGC